MGAELNPNRGLGKLELLHRRLLEQNCKAREYGLVLFAADHEISYERLSIYEPMSSNQIVEQHLSGQSPTTRLLKRLNKREYIVDVGLAKPVNTSIEPLSSFGTAITSFFPKSSEFSYIGACAGSRNFMQDDALKENEVIQAINQGWDFWHILSGNSFDIIGVGEIGIANTLCAAALAVATMGLSPNRLVGRGSSSDAVIARKIEIICQALKFRCLQSDNIVDLITRFGGLDIAALVGFIIGAAENGVSIMLDGYVTAVAALLATILDNRVPGLLIAPSLSDQVGHSLILERLGLEPLFDLDINYGEGLAAIMGLFLAESTEIFYN